MSTGAVEVNFGLLQSAHPMTGVAILNGDYAPVGTPIAAMSGETECGVSTVTTAGGSGLLMYQMEAVNSNGEKGCPEDGEDWTVLLGGQPAATVACCDPSEGANLIVLPDHAWYWAVGPVIGSPAAGTAVQAFVGDVLCGQTVLEKRQWVFEPHVGIERLVVPSEALAPGCGRAGATVAFMIGDYEVTAEWQAGISYIELPLESVWGDVQIACDGAVTIGDALMTARWLVGFISLDPWPPCFWIGAPLIVDGEPQIWGDVDCNGAVSIGDAVKIARHLLGLPVQQTQPCPEIGAKILVQ